MNQLTELMELAERQHGVLTAEQCGAGLTRHQLRRLLTLGVLERVRRGIYRVRGTPATWRQQLMIEVLLAGPTAAVSHESAGALLGARGFRPGPLFVTRHGHRRAERRSGVVYESSLLPPHHVHTIDNLPVTTPARLVFDLCRKWSDERVGRVLDDLLSARGATPAPFERVLADLGKRGRPGTARMRRLLDTRGAGYVPTESELEDLAIAVLARAGIESPTRQRMVGDTLAPIGRVDLVWLRARFVLEVDSRTWHDGWSATVDDRRRDARLLAAGWRILRVTYWQLQHEPDVFIAAVRTILAQAA